ncbi:formyltetrahydrofolate deformylase [Streptomyces sp. SAI-208]|uniref:formyltetrahydrofolate deformylase n=1 Tax=unclassified Streptomyces TaxID=2593676 RepID=UPI0024731810|nr:MULTISPECIES: formyltetrahydrofolate deformylase [unclassified Streptomyces]MDH6513918.1 formyltetrahydrofolate deformylase [Streptomyces sp. SAI-090]MDH6546094.1 formyltetrahydrofolate deformylase [Streptomyces sp. SAI-041]MDH6565175.1 formyltetrahydrofolate deformylase [Streptomyces sp. SAI-117]MDH6604757.1 formyltetrahydrofolate deformylase [Streptomyces sp. SAI-208]MDH6622001.1 formyltetrahydrofolate deformylase [Streptomyces sp. SAI-135]
MQRYILTLRCPDQPGIVHALAAGVAQAEGNILESAQFSDPGTGIFTIRVSLETPAADTEKLRDALALRLARFDPVLSVRPEEQRRRVLLMVSKFDHCLVDLLYRWDLGELPVDIPLIVSNHPDLEPVAKRYGIPFVHLPVSRDTKPEAEAELLRLAADHQVDFVVLARYMQVLSDDLCRKLSGRVINIHHSFLPGFKGAKPYHQAHDRGVKLIGATAHFVTADLDEGPIIEQDVVRVGHRHTAPELVAIGRDVERIVLARAVRLHAEDRVVLTGSRTVVFA